MLTLAATGHLPPRRPSSLSRSSTCSRSWPIRPPRRGASPNLPPKQRRRGLDQVKAEQDKLAAAKKAHAAELAAAKREHDEQLRGDRDQANAEHRAIRDELTDREAKVADRERIAAADGAKYSELKQDYERKLAGFRALAG